MRILHRYYRENELFFAYLIDYIGFIHNNKELYIMEHKSSQKINLNKEKDLKFFGRLLVSIQKSRLLSAKERIRAINPGHSDRFII